ncbi:hypothetical protein PYW08_005852 [Mythimna loreyi]|uniref:Uncharacterized protein n=1 Tax=Mythimna loreyi TaxID=667449 RepID=A0ACC2QHQ3_9NEOP|nr:hypothetical protein PYW08_005852 [Mythimna loreyi]
MTIDTNQFMPTMAVPTIADFTLQQQVVPTARHNKPLSGRIKKVSKARRLAKAKEVALVKFDLAKARLALLESEPPLTGSPSQLVRFASKVGNAVVTLQELKCDECISELPVKYMHRISLSSRTGGLDYFMTGAQNLVFIAKLKGYPEELAMLFAYKALKCMGLLANDPLVSNYSSGCLRRLSLCSALVLGPTVAFLDEPMRGVDASSKPLVANALQRLKGLPAAVVVAESTLDWRLLEPAYDRIAIMAQGQFATIGPAPEILEAVARGYSARIKLKMFTSYRGRALNEDSSETDTESELELPGPSRKTHSDKSVIFATSLNDLKAEFLATFTTSTLCKEHLSMLFFIIEDEYKMERYSDMFRKLQALKEKYSDLIEDYYLSSVTVEDVFWRFQYEKGVTMDRVMSLTELASNSALASTSTTRS